MRVLKFWLPVVVWAIIISLFSTDFFSSAHTSLFFIPILHWLFPSAGAAALETMHVVIRKSAHVFEYFVFSALLFRTFRGANRGWQWRWAMFALFVVAGYSALDEFHQSFVPSRGARVTDSILDTCAGALAQLALWWWIRSHHQSPAQPSDENQPVATDA